MSEINWLDMHKHATTSLEGEFNVVIVDTEVKKTNDQTKDMIKYKAKIESGPFVDRPLNGQFVISPDSPVAMRILFGHWAILGLNQAYFNANPNAPIQQIASDLVGRRAVVKVGTRQWQGRDIEEIQEWKPALGGPGGGATPLGGAGLGGVLGGNTGGPLGGLTTGPSSPTATPAAAPSGPSPTSPAAPVEPSSPAPALPF